MPNKTKQNTKNSTEQICSQPLYKSQTTHHTQPTPKRKNPSGRLRRQPPPTGAGRSHGVEREPDSVLESPPPPNSSRETFYAQPKNAPTPTTHNPGSKHMQAQENNQHTNQTANMLHCSPLNGLPRKEVIQPHLPVRLPCYDFVPIANPTFDHSPHKRG